MVLLVLKCVSTWKLCPTSCPSSDMIAALTPATRTQCPSCCPSLLTHSFTVYL